MDIDKSELLLGEPRPASLTLGYLQPRVPEPGLGCKRHILTRFLQISFTCSEETGIGSDKAHLV